MSTTPAHFVRICGSRVSSDCKGSTQFKPLVAQMHVSKNFKIKIQTTF